MKSESNHFSHQGYIPLADLSDRLDISARKKQEKDEKASRRAQGSLIHCR